jgi:hypothetical protein
LVGFVLYACWAVFFVDSVAYAAGAIALLALVVVRRLEGVREDLGRRALLPVVVDRVLFDRRPARRFAEEGRP